MEYLVKNSDNLRNSNNSMKLNFYKPSPINSEKSEMSINSNNSKSLSSKYNLQEYNMSDTQEDFTHSQINSSALSSHKKFEKLEDLQILKNFVKENDMDLDDADSGMEVDLGMEVDSLDIDYSSYSVTSDYKPPSPSQNIKVTNINQVPTTTQSFWKDSRNKSKMFFIFHFLGFEMLEAFKINKNVHQNFSIERKNIKTIDTYSKQLLSQISSFDDFLWKPNIIHHILHKSEEKTKINENSDFSSYINDISIIKSFFYKKIFMKNIYEKFKKDIGCNLDNRINKHLLELITPVAGKANKQRCEPSITLLETLLHIYLDIKKYFNKNLTITNFDMTINDEGLGVVKNYIDQIILQEPHCKFSLNFSKNKLTDKSSEIFISLAERNLIYFIDISGNQFMTDERKKLIYESLKNCNSLQVIKGSPSNVQEMNMICNVVKFSKSLLELDLSNTFITDEKIKILMDSLNNNKNISIQTLKMRKCYLTNNMVAELAKFIEKNKTLKKLNLSDNSFSSEGIKALFKSLNSYNYTDNDEASTPLEILEMQNNRFSIKVIKELYNLILNNTNLHTINLSGPFPNLSKEQTLNKLLEFFERDRYVNINEISYTLENNNSSISNEEKIESKICRTINFPKEKLIVHCGTSAKESDCVYLCDRVSPYCGDWGLGIGDWAQSPIPNPQSPIPILFHFKL
jgi:hypothetical protein